MKQKMAARMQTRSHSHAKECYLLTGKMEYGICGGFYVGTQRRRDNDDTLWTAYGCNRRLKAQYGASNGRQRSLQSRLVKTN